MAPVKEVDKSKSADKNSKNNYTKDEKSAKEKKKEKEEVELVRKAGIFLYCILIHSYTVFLFPFMLLFKLFLIYMTTVIGSGGWSGGGGR